MSDFPLDSWVMDSGTWGTDATQETTTVLSGGYSVQIEAGGAGAILQARDFVALDRTQLYRRKVVYQADRADGGDNIRFGWSEYDSTEALLGISHKVAVAPAIGSWVTVVDIVKPAFGACAYVKPEFGADGAGFNVYFAEVDLRPWPRSFQAYRNGAFAIPNAAWTQVEFNAEDYDYGSDFDPTAGNFHFDVPHDGLWHFDATITLSTATDGVYTRAALYVNAGRVKQGEPEIAGAATVTAPGIHTDLDLSAGDVVDVRVYQNGPGVNTGTGSEFVYFAGHEVRS